MKAFVILACIALACAWPVERESGGRDKGGRGKGGRGKEGMSGTGAESVQPEIPEGPVKPLTGEELFKMLEEAQNFAGEVRGKFEQLKSDADSVQENSEDMAELAEKTKDMLKDLDKLDEERTGPLGKSFMTNMMRLIYAGVEDEGQCHKVLEYLITLWREAEQTKRSAEEEKFWQEVVKNAKEEVGCIINRFNEFKEMITHVQEAMKNPPQGYDEEGHAFEAEVLMGSLYFGFGHLYRQVAVFAGVMHELLGVGEESEGARAISQLRSLLKQTESLESRMNSMRLLRRKY